MSLKIVPFKHAEEELVSAAVAGNTYTLNVVNNSTQPWTFYVYQQNPGNPSPSVFSLAWFAKTAYPGVQVSFSWTLDYSFIWSETGTLIPGVQFTASQTVPANLTTANLINFDQPQTGAYNFSGLSSGGTSGSLTIVEGASITPLQTSVGIGMSGAGTFVTQGQPSVSSIFTPTPTYWVSFGTNVQQGTVLSQVVGGSSQITFLPGQFAVTKTLNPDNTWS